MIATFITALYLLGIVSMQSAISSLYIMGGLLIAAELMTFTTFGILAVNGAISLVMGYMIDSGAQTLFGIDVDWSFFFGVSFAEAIFLIGCILTVLHIRRQKITTGIESMIGADAEVLEWKNNKGRVRVQGEDWQAISNDKKPFKIGDITHISSVDKLTVRIEKK